MIRHLEGEHCCLAPDLPGFGESPPLVSGLRRRDRLVAMLEGLRREQGASRLLVAGHDAGAMLAIRYATTYPERVERLALLAAPLFPDVRPPWPLTLLRVPVVGNLLAPAMISLMWNAGFSSAVGRDDPEVEEIVSAFRRPFQGWSGSQRLARLLRWGKPPIYLGETAALLQRVEAPTLVVHGRRDGSLPEDHAHRAVKILPQARAEILNGGHFLPLEIPTAVAESLRRFFAGDVAPGGASAGS